MGPRKSSVRTLRPRLRPESAPILPSPTAGGIVAQTQHQRLAASALRKEPNLARSSNDGHANELVNRRRLATRVELANAIFD